MGGIACVKPPQTIFTIHGIIIAYYIDFGEYLGDIFVFLKKSGTLSCSAPGMPAFTEDFVCRRIEKSRRECFMDSQA